jgi:murein DD-endopeptidase MepM/ murein hydrolase activator NlpD
MKQRAALIFFLVMLMAVSLPNFTPPVQANGAYGAIDYISATEIERVEGKSGAFATPNADLFQTSQLGDNAIPQGWPLQGKITSPFGKRTSPFVTPSTAEANLETEFHTGVDIGVVEGTPVLATADGVVEYAGNERGGYGEVVFITHSGGYTTVYGHNS